MLVEKGKYKISLYTLSLKEKKKQKEDEEDSRWQIMFIISVRN